MMSHGIDLLAWLVVLSIVSLALALASAAYIHYDVVARKGQMMAVMKWAWPITALYMGPFAVWAYRAVCASVVAASGAWRAWRKKALMRAQ